MILKNKLKGYFEPICTCELKLGVNTVVSLKTLIGMLEFPDCIS